MDIFKELDNVIADYVGYDEDDGNYEEDGRLWIMPKCADQMLYDSIVDECTRHVEGSLVFEDLGKDAKWCLEEWESVMNSMSLSRDM